jgi:hypothetical protein
VLCRFWRDSGVWNGSAVDLPIAVFGAAFEEAQQNMTDAVLAYLHAARKLGRLEGTVQFLRKVARERSLTMEEMALQQPLVRISAALQDNQILAVV